MKPIGHFIAGQMLSSQSQSSGDIYNPVLGKVTAQVSFADQKVVKQAIDAAKAAWPQWAATSPLKRARVLFKFKALLENHTDKLAQLLTREHGKILADAKGEVGRAIELAEFTCGMPKLMQGDYSENVGTGVDCYTIRQPLGVCVGVTPFNFPVMISTWMLAPAIACGNTFILKPSEKDPSAPLLIAELLKEAGLPDGVFNVVNGDKNAVEALITDEDVAAVSCVGSTPVAQSIYQTAIAHGKRAQAFGGAKNHAIVMPDADIDHAASEIAAAAFGAAGERCMALSVALAVGDQVGDQLVAKLKEEAIKISILPGSDAKAEMGPLVTAEHRQRVLSYVELGVKEGAQLVVDGRDVRPKGHEQGFFMGACLFDQVKSDMRIYKEEIFGPVLVVLRVADFEQALKLINDHEFGNGTAIFTQSGAAGREFASRVQVGMVGINVPIPVPIAYHSFGGWKRSVFGDTAMHGEEGMKFYTKAKSITQRWPVQKTVDSRQQTVKSGAVGCFAGLGD